MISIAVLIPTFGRVHKLKELVRNFNKYSKVSNLYFIAETTDFDTTEWLKNSNLKHFVVSGEYVEAINYGYKHTSEPFIFCGADDIEFTKDWDIKLLKNFEDENIHVTGGVDDWVCSRAGIHISHPLIRRSYIKNQGSCWGQKDVIYYPGYKHYHCDIELEQLAWTRGCIKVDTTVTIKHNHFVNQKVEQDATYKRSYQMLSGDTKLYEQRKPNFAYWLTTSIHQGKKIPSPYRKKRLSIIMPVWNCKEYVDKTVDSLIKNTLHKYEIIVIDDCSTEFGKEYLKELEEKLSQCFINVVVLRNKEQKYCNYNWNKGVSLATGDYIAIINADIEFETEEWDDFLIENIDLGYELASPFQSDRVYPDKPYMLPKPPDVCSRQHLRGACFLMSRPFANKVLNIKTKCKHWFMDNLIGDLADTWIFDIRVSIYHYISKSGEKINQFNFWTMIAEDVKNYVKETGNEQPEIARTCRKNIQYHS